MKSVDAADYQGIPRSVAVMVKGFPRGATTGRHAHERGQVLYATAGLMIARTDLGSWAVPTGHALLIPPALMHEVAMHGDVRMLTAYVEPKCWRQVASPGARVILVSRLLDAGLEAISEEPVCYGQRGRRLAALILEEVRRAEVADLALPMPGSEKLRQMCTRMLTNPAIAANLDGWADDLGISRRTLTRRFADETGLSFGQWRRRLRQLHSMQLAAQGASMKDIAGRVGYRSPQALQAMMRRAK